MDADRWKQIDDLLEAVIDLEPDKRSAFLDEACAGDVTLRKEIEILLVSDQRSGSFIDVPALHLPSSSRIPADEELVSSQRVYSLLEAGLSSKDTLYIGQTLAGRYQILARLGRGGMGDVWQAYDLKLRVDVALKALRSSLIANQDVAEFLRAEVRSARQVISPNVCRIFDLIEAEDQEFISMEYLDGMTLFSFLQQKGPIELNEARDIALQFLAGLEAIHRAGLVHCDLKPENIMITRTGRVLVMDFGIAKKSAQKDAMISGTFPYMSPEQVSGQAVNARSDLFSAGIILAEMIHPQGIVSKKTREEIWNIVHKTPQHLPDNSWKAVIARAVSSDPSSRFASAQEMAHALEEATDRTQTRDERGPYPGLASFNAADSQYFFGREFEVENVIHKLQELHLMALVGPSGAGKTSFLRAGLIPSLPEGWSSIFCVPGDSPFINLSQAIERQLSDDSETFEKSLRVQNADDLLPLIQRLRKKNTEVVLVLDRFEELFTLNAQEVQLHFAEFVGKAVLEADVRVLLSLRDDFLIRCSEYSVLAPIFSELTPLRPLTGLTLRRAFVQPALKSGYRFEDETLVDDIVNDVEKERGALPLMAFAAARLWDKRDRERGMLTRKSYISIGGVAGALAQHAEETMDRIGTNREPFVREIFRNLVTAENTRAARDAEDLLSVFEPAQRGAAEEVLHILIDARLLTSFEAFRSEAEAGKRRIEIIHESLLSVWPRLVRWQTQDADSAQLRDQLRQAAQIWEQKNRTEDLLWTGTAFLEFQAWRQRYSGSLTPTENAFAQAMTIRTNKQRYRRRIVISTIFIVLLGLLGIVINFWYRANSARDNAVSQARRAEAGKILAVGRALTDADASTKLAYAIASLEFADLPEARRFALQTLSAGPPALVKDLPVLPVNSIEFSPDGKWIAAGVRGGLQLLPQDGTAPITLSETYLPGQFIPWSSQFSADGEFLIWTMRQDTRIVKVWSMSQKKVIRTFHLEGTTICLVKSGNAFLITDATGSHDSPFSWTNTVIRKWTFDKREPEIVGRLQMGGIYWKSFDIDSEGRWIAFVKGKNIYVKPLNVSESSIEKVLGAHDTLVKYIKFRPNTDEFASADAYGIIQFWSLSQEKRKPIRTINANAELKYLWFDPDGRFFLATRGLQILRWDLTAPDDADPLVFQFSNSLNSITFDKKNHWMAVIADSGIAFIPLTHVYPYIFHGTGFSGSNDVRFTPDGKSFLDGFSDDKSSILIWNLPGQTQLPTRYFWNPDRGNITTIDVDPLGRYVLAGLTFGEVHLISIADRKASALTGSPTAISQDVVFSRDGKYAAAALEDPSQVSSIQIWDLRSSHSWVLEQSKGKSFYSLQYSPNGTLLAGDSDGNLYQWDPIRRSEKILRRGNGIVSGIAISPDGHYVAVITWSTKEENNLKFATSDFTLLDLKTGKSIPIRSHGDRVFSVGFDPNGTTLVTGDLDGSVRVGPLSGKAPYLLLGHESRVESVVVHPSGKWIASTESDKPVVRLWAMPQGEVLSALSYSDFLNRLRNLTNVRIVPDNKSSNGYRIQYAPFPGWSKTLNW